ncbi:MAG: hypothetical protein LBG52_05520 [Candidatus Peribacteria bacterium]|jgi:hypothetical protein|nr:hypothetical protein [Candidatus Peribacteria bacterium]
MLFITKALESYMEKNRTKKALLQLYLEIFKRDSVDKIGKQIIDVEDKYYNILEQTIQHIEE